MKYIFYTAKWIIEFILRLWGHLPKFDAKSPKYFFHKYFYILGEHEPLEGRYSLDWWCHIREVKPDGTPGKIVQMSDGSGDIMAQVKWLRKKGVRAKRIIVNGKTLSLKS